VAMKIVYIFGHVTSCIFIEYTEVSGRIYCLHQHDSRGVVCEVGLVDTVRVWTRGVCGQQEFCVRKRRVGGTG
jgi:hypothetical protein